MDAPFPHPPFSAQTGESNPSFLKRWRIWLVVGGAIIVSVVILMARSAKVPDASGAAGRAVPVLAAKARKGDMAVSLTGLGTVTAENTVTVRSRVDGQLIRVAFTEGQIVHQGDLLAEIDPRPFQVQLMQAEGQMAKDEAAFKNASMDQERFRSLVQQGILPKQQLDAQISTVNQVEGALKSDKAQVESAKLNLTFSRITAPISGRVGLRLVDLGNMVRATDPNANGLAVIAPIQPINVVFTIPADSIQKVMAQNRKGLRLPVEAWDRDLRTRLASGSLAAIDNQVDTATGTVKLKALFANDDASLFPNQFVNARLMVDTVRDTVIIPTAAVQRSPQGAFVYVIKGDSTVEMRPIEVQGTEGDDTAVKRGLEAGEMVVTDGLEKLRPGSKVSLPKPEGADPGKGK